MQKVAIIHGTKATPEDNWFPWLKIELRSNGLQVVVPKLPTPEGQTLKNWLSEFNTQIGDLDENSILVGHSVGAVFALRYLETINHTINTVAVIAGFTGKLGLPEYDSLNASFVSEPFNWNKIKGNASKFICISGDNDPYVPFQQSEEISKALNTDHIVIPNAGHLNSEFGYRTFPKLLELLI